MKKLFLVLFLMIITLSMNTSRVVGSLQSSVSPDVDTSMRSPTRLCYALDVVFLIDQSASMSGETWPPSNPNDPEGFRFESPRYALDWLANNRLGLCPNVIHRVGVISFGTEAVIDLPLTEIEPANQQSWDQIREGLENKIEEKNLDATNPIAAFERAKEMLDSAGPLGDEPRKRAIVLLTDGQPCVPGVGCSLNTDDPVNEKYIQDLMDYIRENFAFDPVLKEFDAEVEQAELTYGGIGEIPEEKLKEIFSKYNLLSTQLFDSTYIFIVAMNDDSPYIEIVGDSFEAITSEYGGDLIDLEKNDLEIPKQFNKILSKLAGVTPRLFGCGNLPVNPYLSGAVLDVFKMAEGLEVEITFNGKSLKAGQGDSAFFGVTQYSQFGAVEHYRFTQPPAGLWKIDATNCNGIEASFIEFQAQVEQTEPANIVPQYNLGDALYDPKHPAYLKFKITDTENQVNLVLNQNYPLQMEAIIIDPEGAQFTRTFEFEAGGLWKSTEAIPTRLDGKYTFSVTGKAECIKDTEITSNRCPEPLFEVFSYSEGSYEVGKVAPFTAVILSPKEGENIPLHGTFIPEGLADQPVQVELQLFDGENNPVDYENVLLGTPQQAFTASLTVTGGRNVSVNLTPDATDHSIFRGEVLEPSISGNYQLRVEINLDQYNYQTSVPQGFPLVRGFTRIDSLFRNPLFYTIILIIMIVIMVILIGIFIRCKLNALKGELLFTSGADKKNLPLHNGRCRKTFSVNKGIAWLRDIGVEKIIVRHGGSQGSIAKIKITIVRKKATKKEVTLLDSQKSPASSIMLDRWTINYSWGGTPRGYRPPQPPRPRNANPRRNR